MIYRPNTLPRADLDLFINNLLEIQGKICNENKTAYLIGDYNINLLKFGSHKKTNDFTDNVISQGFVPYILKPTRITATSATLIDHIFSNHTSPGAVCMSHTYAMSVRSPMSDIAVINHNDCKNLYAWVTHRISQSHVRSTATT